jgi:energy-coupling factor transporter ATP-binding protein EcfA2
MAESATPSIARITNEGTPVYDQYVPGAAVPYGPDGYFVNWEAPRLKSRLRRALPKYVRSAHLTEAIAAAFRFKSHAAMLAAINANPHVAAWPGLQRLYRRLDELVSSAGTPFDDGQWREVTGSLQNAFGETYPGRPTHTLDAMLVGHEQTHLTPEAVSLLKDAVSRRRRILVTGKVGTGKTTLVECLADLLGKTDGITSDEVVNEIWFRPGRDIREVDTKQAAPKTWPTAAEMKDRLLLVNDLTMNGEQLGPGALTTAAFAKGCLMSSPFISGTKGLDEPGHMAERMTRRLREWSDGAPSVIDMIVCVDNPRVGWWIESNGSPGSWIESIWDLSSDWKLTRQV